MFKQKQQKGIKYNTTNSKTISLAILVDVYVYAYATLDDPHIIVLS